MAAQKPGKEAAKASKVSPSATKQSQKKDLKSVKGASLKGSSVAAEKESTKKGTTKETKVAKAPLTEAVTKLTKPSSVPSIVKNVVKAVEKKLKEPVKKTPEADKKEIKPVSAKKEVSVEKKSKADASVEKESKAAKSPKSDSEKPAKPVVIPKTSTDKKVDYEPDFMKSVLDAPAVVSQGPTMRYSDSELQEFRELIGKKLDAAKKELAYLQGLITRRDEMGGDETDNRYMTMEDGGMSMEREQLSQMASRQITFIDHLEKAIMRIENKTYGICRVTGKLIDKARLRAVPHATLSMEAKLGITK
ncbi:TraR/DksA C4-type zinc finger protein [Segetibacter sp.]|jgi:RNA polymerase-binding transcription factor DksA|uniref:TraR/DksA family transcriptional regulator n=1 Tax=Segetibacter sp. TaxID=2231182 RepID=UPI002609202C|nr:TraR/DksA C4-type zinc finger protein [Segetibacter sp.]MCW3081333.1 TraR/DksA family transcriptional regulator [Segetibacter sp.]